MSSSGDSMKQRTPLRHAGMRSQMEISLLCLNAARFGGCDSNKNEPILTDKTGAGGAEEMTLLVKEIAAKHEDPVSDPLLSHKMLGRGAHIIPTQRR